MQDLGWRFQAWNSWPIHVYRYTVKLANFLVTNNSGMYLYASKVFYSELIRALRPNPKKNMVHGTLCRSCLLSRLQSRLQHIYHGQPYARVDLNPMPESTLSSSQRLRIWPPYVDHRTTFPFVFVYLNKYTFLRSCLGSSDSVLCVKARVVLKWIRFGNMKQLREGDQIVIKIWNDNHQQESERGQLENFIPISQLFPGQIIRYKCLVPIYVFPEMNQLFPKQNFNLLPTSSYTHISEIDLYIYRIGMPILLQENMWTNPGNI